jgi:hypothetical protein
LCPAITPNNTAAQILKESMIDAGKVYLETVMVVVFGVLINFKIIVDK